MGQRKNNTQDAFNFDLNEGERRKEDGLALAGSSTSRKQLLELARQYAVVIARQYGCVTFDDVFVSMLRNGVDPTALGNAAGSVFRGDEFIFTGRWEKSQRVSNHSRVNRVWKLKASLNELIAK